MRYFRSRIYVKDLPKHATEDRLREFFSEKGEITDCKLIRTRDGKSRQFAFIGYRTEQEAEEAIRYFNKSYLDTSRISCEFALKQGDPNIPCPQSWYSKKKEEKTQGQNQNQVSDGKDKTEKSANISQENGDPKFVEFFQVMQPRSKSKLWENDLVAPTLEHIAAGSEESTQLQQEEKGSMKKLNTAKTAQDDGMHDENTDRPPKLAHDLEVSDMEYFQHRVKKEWSDSESDSDDENGINMDQHDDNSGPEGNQKELGVQNFTASVGQNTLKGVGVFEESGGEFVSSVNPSSPQDAMLQPGRLYVRNLPYAATEDELADLFSKFGNIADVHLVIDKETKQSKGFAYVLYSAPEAASRALEELDHSTFQGRLLHVMPAKVKDAFQDQEAHLSVGKAKTFKQQREEERKTSEAAGNTRALNTLYMRSDTVVENIARKYGVSKSELLDREADDLAVRIALGETQIIAETKKALANAGINVTSLEEFASGKTEGVKRSNHVLLVKNLPYSSTEGELSNMFGKFGSIDKIILPPTRTLALVIFLEPAEARAAFRGLAYKRYKDAPLYLEWAPSNILSPDAAPDNNSKNNMVVGVQEAKKFILEQAVEGISQAEIDPDRVESRSLYIKNLYFRTSDERLKKHLTENMKEGKVLSVRIKKHLKNGKNLSMGFGFVEFDSMETASNVCRDLQGTVLDGHALIMQLCHIKNDENVLKKAEKDKSSTKLIVRNVAFEATEKDLRQLFNPFGQIKSLRLPMKLGKHRGFAFVEFVTKQEAQNALKALSSTHLYGRHLVLERAKEGETLEELRKRTAAQFTTDQNDFTNPTRISKKRKVTTY